MLLSLEVEHIHQVANCRTVDWYIGIGASGDGIGEIITTTLGER